MASRKPPSAQLQANLTVDQMRRGIIRIEKIIREIEAFDTSKLTKRWSSPQKALEATIEGALSSIFGHDTVEYKRYSRSAKLDHGGITMIYGDGYQDDSREAKAYVAEGKADSIQILQSAVQWLQDEIVNTEESPAVSPVNLKREPSRRIFIVHGHDIGAQQTVARFIESIDFEAVILSEQASQGRTIIEKIEANDDVGFAVVLLTPDDLGGKTIDTLHHRARQNVLLELGYFIAKLSRKCVCTLAKGDLEIPTDFAGVVWEPLDDGGAWKTALSRELKAAGYVIDWNKVMS